MLIKKFFNIITTFNKIIIIKFIKLHSQLIKKMKKFLFIMKCS